MMSTPTTKADRLASIDEQHAEWTALLTEVDAARLDQPGAAGDWSFRDVAAHLNAWRDLTVARLVAASRDVAPQLPWPDGMEEETTAGVEEINRWFIERDRDRPAAEIIAESHEQFRQMREAIAALSLDDLHEPGRFVWLGGAPLSAVLDGASEHLQEHMAEIRTWLDSAPHPASATEP